MENLTAQQRRFIELAITKNDDVFVANSIIDFPKSINFPTRRGYEQAIISNGTLVNVVSKGYGHLPNQNFFGEVERQLNEANIGYVKKSINREDRSFSVDYILNDESLLINVNGNNDKLLPMLSFTTSYDGSVKTSGSFGVFRQICSNGLHGTKMIVGFSVKKRGNVASIILPKIDELIALFIENEYYTISRKFEVLAEKQITDVKEFVKMVATDLNLFQFEASATNSEPSLNARLVIDTITKEQRILGIEKPTLWLGYNAFNELIHDKLKKTFDQQKALDSKVFEHILEMA